MTGGSAGVATRLDDLDRNALNSAYASEDQMVLALRDELLQEGYSLSGIDIRPELRILRDNNGRAIKVRVYARDVPAFEQSSSCGGSLQSLWAWITLVSGGGLPEHSC